MSVTTKLTQFEDMSEYDKAAWLVNSAIARGFLVRSSDTLGIRISVPYRYDAKTKRLLPLVANDEAKNDDSNTIQ